jgi:hypothetical protein
MAAKAPETHAMQTFGQLLEQSSPDDILSMAARLKPRLAHHHNSQPSVLFTKLPAELIMQIGQNVLESNAFWHDRYWFSEALPLLQTSVHLRASLRPLLSETLTCYMWIDDESQALAETLQKLEKWKKNWPHELRVRLIVNISSGTEVFKMSAAAALAGDIERAVYGTLLDEPAVFVRCPDLLVRVKGTKWLFVSCRGREGEIIAWPEDLGFRYLDQEEAALVWAGEERFEEDWASWFDGGSCIFRDWRVGIDTAQRRHGRFTFSRHGGTPCFDFEVWDTTVMLIDDFRREETSTNM